MNFIWCLKLKLFLWRYQRHKNELVIIEKVNKNNSKT